jgi:hypothetical protein
LASVAPFATNKRGAAMGAKLFSPNPAKAVAQAQNMNASAQRRESSVFFIYYLFLLGFLLPPFQRGWGKWDALFMMFHSIKVATKQWG